MASATNLAASSSSLLCQWKYDVFLSFRGEDTRKNFADHLYVALCQKGIKTFRDDEKLDKGKAISLEIFKAIEESRFSIIIFSRNYASSTWCLDELAKIVECMKQKSMIVYPVFYHVDPSEVRYQSGSFAEAFVKHEEDSKENTDRTQRWRNALKEVANLSGWDLKNSYESTIVGQISTTILGQSNFVCSSVSKNLIGISSRIEKMMSLCKDLKVDDVCFMGIYRMGGIGKTTLAHAIYEKLSYQFEASVFLDNIREETKIRGLVALQKKLLSMILKEREIDIQNVKEGVDMIQKRLHGKKVLIILDDVDKPEQLCALAQTRDWFGGGSKIIITTRNKRILIEHDVGEDETYEAKELNYIEALKLFSWKAFKEDQPPINFVELSKEFLDYANGHPLALEVLGSSLYRRSQDLWKSMLRKVKRFGNDKIHAILQVSFDGLSEMEKEVFLDIVCFLNGEEKDRAREILESCGYEPNIIIDDLISKSLVKIQQDKLWTHDLLENMGQMIVYSESLEEPGSRSRLWLTQDICHVLKNDTGTIRVKGMVLKSSSQEELHLNPEAFLKMKNLRLLKISNVLLSQGLNHLPNKLRVMEWLEYPLKSLPKKVIPPNLVELIMPCSYLRSVWKGNKNLYELKILDLRDSQNLIKTPNFTGLPNLEKLILQGCVKLSKVNPSIGNLKRLTFLNLKDCKSLNGLPCDISLDSLEILILSGCLKIKKFPEIVGNMKRLSQLFLDGTSIKELPLSMEHLTSLTLMNLESCKGLLTLPRVLSTLTSLKKLNLSGSLIFDKIPRKRRNLEYLEELDICGTTITQAHSHGFGPLLLTSRFFNHWSLPKPDVGLVLPTLFPSLCFLTELNLSYCNLSHGAIPSDLSRLSSLEFLDLSGNKFEYISESIFQLSKLKRVYLEGCSRVRSLPKFGSSIHFVRTSYCTSLERNLNESDIINYDEKGLYILRGNSLGVNDYFVQNPDIVVFKQSQEFVDPGRVVFCVSPGDGIPMLFNTLNNGCFVKLQIDRDSNDRGNWLLCALYFEYEAPSLCKYVECSGEFVIHFDTDEGPLKKPLNLHYPTGLYRYCVYIPLFWFRERSHNIDTWSYIEASITSSAMDVHMCRGRLIYKRDAKDFLQICAAYPFFIQVCP